MALFQTGSGYRDATKALTIKALQERQKQAAAFSSAAQEIQQPMIDPLQGVQHLSGVLSGAVQQRRADSAESDARQRLSSIMAGIDPEKGASMQQIAEMQTLDPEFATKEYERAMAERAANRDREDAQAHALALQTGSQTFTAGESEKTRTATSEENELNRQADVARQKLSDANADNRQDDAQLATQELARIQAQLDETKATADKQREVEAIGTGTEARKAEWLKLNPDGDINSPEAQSYILRDAAPATGGLNSPSALKDINEFKLQGTQLDSALNTVSRAEELLNGGNVVGGDVALWLFDKAGSLPGGTAGLKYAAQMAGYNLTDQQIADTMEFDSIMGLSATEHMANTLKGQSSNMEMQAFRRDMANRNAPDAVKRNAVQRMKNALMADRGALDSTLQQFQQPAMSPYEYKSSATTAPAPGGGGGGGGDGEFQEGDIVSSPGKPDLQLKNGQWVPVQ